MFIPLGDENIIFLENVTAIYREGNKNIILKRSGEKCTVNFTPRTLAKRYSELNKGASHIYG